MDFIHIRFIDIIDILSVAVLMYYLYKMAKGTNAPSIITGIIIIYVLWVLTGALNMELLSSILGNIIGVGVVALIVVFQPEIRQFLQNIGLKQQRNARRNSLWRRLFSGRSGGAEMDLTPLLKAATDMSCSKTGALIDISQETNLDLIIETGIDVDAVITDSLLENIFY